MFLREPKKLLCVDDRETCQLFDACPYVVASHWRVDAPPEWRTQMLQEAVRAVGLTVG